MEQGAWSLSKGCLDRMHLISCSSIVIATLISLAVSFRISRYARPLHLPASACLLSSCLLGRISMFFHLSCSSVCSSVFHRLALSPPFTIIVPDIQPRRFWRVLLQAASIDHLLLGKRVIPRSCFSHLVQLWNGYPSHYNGTFGRFAAFVDFLVYVLYVLCPSKAVQRCATCLYPNDRNANFCQVCGASTGTPVPSISQPDLDMTAVNNHFVELGPCPVENLSETEVHHGATID